MLTLLSIPEESPRNLSTKWLGAAANHKETKKTTLRELAARAVEARRGGEIY